MRALAAPILLASVLAAHAAEVVRVPPWDLHNSFWMSLHERLLEDAVRTSPRALADLAPEEKAAWSDAVAAYKTAGGEGDITFAKPMVITSDALTQVSDDATEPSIDAPLAEALRRAALIYRRHGWAADEKANRFFIAYAAAMLREAGDELIKAHEKVYRTPWPAHVHFFAAPYGGPYGAYTVFGRSGGVITTMSSREASYQGLRALEMILHESSHAVVGPSKGTVAEAIAAAVKKRSIGTPHDLWHAILFATSSELTRSLLAERGSTEFAPSSDDMFSRVWPFYRKAIEDNWIPYVHGQGTLEEAVDNVVGAIKR